MLFFYILLLLSTGSLYSCHQLINPHQFEQLLDAKQAETSAYFNEFARIFRNEIWENHFSGIEVTNA